MIRPIAWLAAIAAVLGLAATAGAQGVVTAPGQDAFWKFQPFLDPGYFEPDFQFFAPAEINDFGGEEKPNTGLYVTFDRTYVGVSRPDDRFSFGSRPQSDFTWGNRMEVGYMKGDPDGWQAVLWHVNGPNERFANAYSQVLGTDAQGLSTQFFLLPDALDTINQLKMSSFELNKVWRRPPFHNQIQFEPFVGYRYMNVRDFWQRQTAVELPPPGATTPEFLLRDTFRSTFENNMHGGQIGARIFRQRGHWMLSADFRFFGLANFQYLKQIHQQSFLPVDTIPPGTNLTDVIGPLPPNLALPAAGGDVNQVLNNQHATQFCFGGEFRTEASYELTRDINLRVGAVFLDLGQGIGRGNFLRFNNQAEQMAGVTFGFTVNR
jgi:hypothetical protein